MMPTVAVVEGVFFAQEHPPAHFHAVIGEHRAQIDIATLRVLKRAKLASVISWAEPRREPFDAYMGSRARETEAGDGYEGIVDLRGIIAEGEIFEPIRNPEHFREVRLSRYGHSIYWGKEDHEEVDFGCDRLREIAEEQAALLARVS